MKKVLFSALALAGIAAAFAAPAQAGQASISGAATYTALNGNSVQSLAGEVVFPDGAYAEDVVVTPTFTGTPDLAIASLDGLAVTTTTFTAPVAGSFSTIEAAIADQVTNVGVSEAYSIGLVNAFQ